MSTIEKADFLEWTKSVWTFPAVSAKKIGHPAPFPEELPNRLIQLYTFEGDVVLDPFAGSGTTCLAALAEKVKDGIVEEASSCDREFYTTPRMLRRIWGHESVFLELTSAERLLAG